MNIKGVLLESIFNKIKKYLEENDVVMKSIVQQAVVIVQSKNIIQ